jgi:hypothetical protein
MNDLVKQALIKEFSRCDCHNCKEALERIKKS